MRQLKLTPKLIVILFIISLIPLIMLELSVQSNLRSIIYSHEGTGAEMQAKVNALEDLAQGHQLGLWGAGVVALTLAVGTAIMFRRSIVRPIEQLQANARRLLVGEFPTFDVLGAEKELTELAGVLREMSTGLHALVIEAELHGKDMEKLYAEANRRATALQTIHNVSQRISTILDIDELLSEIVELIRIGFDYDRVHLFTVDRVTNEIVFCAGAGRAGRIGAEMGERMRISQESAIGHVASTGKSLLVQDFEREPRYRFSPTGPSGYTPPPETRSELVAPLSSGNQVIGVLSVQSDRSGAFSNDDLFVLQELAYQAAGAIINARLYEEAFRRAEEVMALMMTSVAVSTAPDLDVRLEAIAHHASQLIDADGCTVYRLDLQAGVLRPLISLDPHSETMMSTHIPVGAGIIGQVARSGRGEIVNHSERDLRAAGVPGAGDEPECLIAVPLLVSDRTIGVMSVRRQNALEFVPHDLELLTLFASQAAVAIENAELYQQLKERAEVLQRAYKQLEEADKVKDEMIQNISHELRTPLTFVIGYLGLVLEGDMGPLTQAQRDSLQLVYNKANALTRMVNDIIILQTIRIAQPELVPVDIVALARRAIEIVQPNAKQASLQIKAGFSAELIHVSGDTARLAQVFESLLNNAIKFSPDGGEINVRISEGTGKAAGEVCVEVQDTGIGVPTDKLERVFDRFYQVDGTATRRFGGLGMGLAICKEIVEAHGGRIWVESPTSGDHGSTFYFTLRQADYVLFTAMA